MATAKQRELPEVRRASLGLAQLVRESPLEEQGSENDQPRDITPRAHSAIVGLGSDGVFTLRICSQPNSHAWPRMRIDLKVLSA